MSISSNNSDKKFDHYNSFNTNEVKRESPGRSFSLNLNLKKLGLGALALLGTIGTIGVALICKQKSLNSTFVNNSIPESNISHCQFLNISHISEPTSIQFFVSKSFKEILFPVSAFCPLPMPLSYIFRFIETTTPINPQEILRELNLDLVDVSAWEKDLKSMNINQADPLKSLASLIVEIVKQDSSYTHLLQLKDSTGYGPIHWAALTGDVQLVRGLQQLGCDIDAINFKTNMNSFMDLLFRQNVVAYNTLLNAGADINTRTISGNTALNYAAMDKRYEAIKTLLSLGANVNNADKDGGTPLHWATKEIIPLLLQAGADVNAKTSRGITALNYAVMEKKQEEVKILISFGANVNIADNNGRTPLHSATEEIIPLLIQAGADVNAKTSQGSTALFLAISQKKLKESKLLISSMADVNAANNDGWTPLHYADGEIIPLLLQRGADINAITKGGITGITPLHAAALYHSQRKVEILLSHGAKVNAVDSEGATALSYAMSRPQPEKIISILLQFGSVSTSTPKIIEALSHSWELKGHSIFEGIRFEHEGTSDTFTSTYMMQTLKEFAKDYPHIVEDRFNNIIEALNNTLYLPYEFISNSGLIEIYKQGKPVIISANLKLDIHVISIVAQGPILMICNKGLRSTRPIEAYEIDPQKFTEILNEIKNLISLGNVENFYTALGTGNDRSKNHGPLLTHLIRKGPSPICQWIEARKHETTKQAVGNCGWESIETAVYGSLLATFAQQYVEPNRYELLEKDDGENVYELFDSWQQFTKLKTWGAYVKKYSEAPKPNRVEDLVTFMITSKDILEKADKITWHLDLKDKFKEVEELTKKMILSGNQ